MAELSVMTPTQVSGAVQELDELANMLGMPVTERCSILGLSGGAYRSWCDGDVDTAMVAAPELVRRLNYALPLLRRMAANMPMVPAGRGQSRPRPSVN
jgi:hypothetical protein